MSVSPVAAVARCRASDSMVDGVAAECLRRFFKGNVWIWLLRCCLSLSRHSIKLALVLPIL